ncbi:hypothetical protein ACFL3C_04200 [Patescibacteria group bacterium]
MQTDYLEAVKVLIPQDKLERWCKVMCQAAELEWGDLTEDDQTLVFQFGIAQKVERELSQVREENPGIAAKLESLMTAVLSDEPDLEGNELVKFAQEKEKAQGTLSRWSTGKHAMWYLAILGELVVDIFGHPDADERRELLDRIDMLMQMITSC